MALKKLLLTPERTGYAYNPARDVVSVELDGGHSRSRRDIVGSASIVDVQWVLNQREYQYLRAFFNSVSNRGADPFLIDLVLDQPYEQEYTAKFVPNTFRMSDPRGLSFIQSAQLEIVPIDDEEMDSMVVLLHDEDMLTGKGFHTLLEKLVNTDLEI